MLARLSPAVAEAFVSGESPTTRMADMTCTC